MEEEEDEGEWVVTHDQKNGDLRHIEEEELPLKTQHLYDLNDPEQVHSLTKRILINSSLARERLRRSILEAAADLTKEFHGRYLTLLLMTEEGQNLLDSKYPASSFDAVKKGFLFYLNSTGHYLILREHLRHAVSNIIQQCGLIMRPSGFQNNRDFQKFLHDMYIYLSDELHDTLNETGMTEMDRSDTQYCGQSTTRTNNLRHPEVSLSDLAIFAEEAMLEKDFENCHRLHLQRICRENCQSSQTWLDFAVMWCARGDDRMAEIAVRESLKSDPKCVNALLLAGIIAARHGNDGVIDLIGSALQICPLCPEIYVLLAATHRLLGSEVNSKYFFLKARLLHLTLTGRDKTKTENDFLNFSFEPITTSSSSSVNKNDEKDGGGISFSTTSKRIKSKIKKIDPNHDGSSQKSGRSEDKKGVKNPKSSLPDNENEGNDSKKSARRQKISDAKSLSSSRSIKSARSTSSSKKDKMKKKKNSSKEKQQQVKEAEFEQKEVKPTVQNFLENESTVDTNDDDPLSKKNPVTVTVTTQPPVSKKPKKPSYDLPIDVREDNISQMFLPMMEPSIQFTWDVTLLAPLFGQQQPDTSRTMESGVDYDEEGEKINGQVGSHHLVDSRTFSSDNRKEFIGENEILDYQNFINQSSTFMAKKDLPPDPSILVDNLVSSSTPRKGGQSSRKSSRKSNNNDDDEEELNSARKKKTKKGKKSNDSVDNNYLSESERSTKRSTLDSQRSRGKKSPRRKRSSSKGRQKDDPVKDGPSLNNNNNFDMKTQNEPHDQMMGGSESHKVWTSRGGSEYIWTAQLLLQFHAHDFLDGVLARELFYTETRSVPFLYLVSMSLLNRKRERAALQFLEEAISYDPANPFIWEVKGHCHHALGENELAIQSYQKSLQVDGESVNHHHYGHNRQLTYLRLATLCAEMDNVKLAKSVLLTGVNLYPSLSMWLALGNISYKMANYAEAEAAFAQANRRDNTNPIIWGQLAAVSLAQGSTTLAEQCYKWAVRFGLQEGKLMDEIKRLQKEKGFGDPSFPSVPDCIPHDYYLKRLGRQRPLDIYREALETPPSPLSRNQDSRKSRSDTTRRMEEEKELKRRLLARWNQGTMDFMSEEEDFGEVSQEEDEEI